ncbi:hypothetical protein QBL02_08745 [Leucobacter sp. UT-8R-CII-1-4]|uniref:hypothetical protein n=1 Tax=Leucobacter sp. UT-8R-CII-1-4 TaxID=3040075 RepID=UPI0024A83FB6|nr:hypothetical protein [Leucobacter sp. UT-8R-CII-1-4]MDI6023631.1 hypothetical protein [Leucobacter sp. UT-8R-CII-1-4]
MQIQSIRTFVAALVGVLLVRLVAALPAVAAGLAWADGVFTEAGYAGISALALVQAVVTAAVILAYQKVAQRLGDRWPSAEKWMLGSSARPSYMPRYGK